jgi:hypothetical protein
LRLSGDRNGPLDPSVASELELDPIPSSHAAFTWLQVCLDETGTVTAARAMETTSAKASSAFATVAASWKFRPFTLRGRSQPVCSMIRMTFPAGQGPRVETLPLPPPPSTGKQAPIVFAEGALRKFTEGRRISGTRAIVPDDLTKVAIQRSGILRIQGSFRICIDVTGHIESVLPIRSTGYAGYDRRLVAGITQWLYSPYLVDQTAVPVCTAVTFVYQQRPGAVVILRH